MTESVGKLNSDNDSVNTPKISISDIIKHVMLKRADDQFYNPKEDKQLLEWSKKGKFTLSTLTAEGFEYLVFKDGVCTNTEKRKRKSKFYPKKHRGN